MGTRVNYSRFYKDFLPLSALSVLWAGLAIVLRPSFWALVAAFSVAAFLTLSFGPGLAKDYKRRGFIFAEYFWEVNYIMKALKGNDKVDPKARSVYAVMAIFLAAWLVVAPYLSEALFDESLKVGVTVMAILFAETATACLVWCKKIYKIKAS